MSRILVIDDDRGTVETFSLILRLRGLEVDTAANGREGLVRARRQPPDLILTDLRLPDLSGIELLRSLRHEGIDVPSIIMTAFANSSLAIEAPKVGALAYLEKPLLEEDVVAAVERGLAGTRHPRDVVLGNAQSVERWVDLVVRVARSDSEPRTIEDWAIQEAIAPRTLQNRCEAAACGAKRSLDFARMLRAVVQARRTHCSLDTFLDVDPRTLHRLIATSGLPSTSHTNVSAMAFLDTQRFIRNAVAIDGVRSALLRGPLL